ncbi:MAG: hypothetical protein ABI669_16025, partial [Usitatibacter sp.]
MMQNEAMNEASTAVAEPDSAKALPSGQERSWLKAQREELFRRYFKHPDPQENLARNAEAVD